MPVDVLVPPLSQTMDTVVLVEWLKAPGEKVLKGEPLYVIETDKANLEVEAPASGILQEVLAQPGSEVAVKTKIGVILSPEETLSAAPPSEVPGPSSQPVPGQLTGPAGEPLPPERLQRPFASPRARRLAQQEGVDLAQIHPTGPQGMIVERDVRAYVEAQKAGHPKATPVARRLAEAAGLDLGTIAPAHPGARITRADVEAALAQAAGAEPGPGEALPGGVPLSLVRRTIARRLLESWRNAPQVTLIREVDATALVEVRDRILEGLPPEEIRPSYTDFLLSIVARCLRQHPQLNAWTDGERLDLRDEVWIGMAVDTERGLVVPVIRDADRKGLRQLAAERQELVRRALEGALSVEDVSGATFTITNLGPLGIDAFTPIVSPPQVAILGLGRIRPGPAVYRGQLCIRHLLSLGLTFDHRAVDGAPAARFLADVAQLIEEPHRVWLYA